jgi:6-phosphogluconolactonase (cycloisomerase 2 family)
MRKRGVTALTVVLVSMFFAAAAYASPAEVVGHVYVNDNTSGTNTIAAFDRHADGSLTPLAGSPFAAGGAGTGKGLASQGALEATEDGRYLLAVDAGSNQVSVLRVRGDGSLELVDVVASGGNQPVSLAVHDQLVYVANTGAGGADYTGFTLSRDGALAPLAGSTVALPDAAQPGDVLFSSDGRHLVGTRIATSQIDSFDVGRDGRLRPAPGSPFPAQGPGPFGSQFRPTDPSQLFVSNAHGAPNSGTVSAFSVAGDGTLSPIGGSPFADHQTAPCWVEISPDGRVLFTVNTASSSVSSYRITDHGTLRLVGSTALNDPSGLAPVDARLSPDGRELLVVDSGAAAVSSLRVTGARLHESSSSPTPLPAGAAPAGVVVS